MYQYDCFHNITALFHSLNIIAYYHCCIPFLMHNMTGFFSPCLMLNMTALFHSFIYRCDFKECRAWVSEKGRHSYFVPGYRPHQAGQFLFISIRYCIAMSNAALYILKLWLYFVQLGNIIFKNTYEVTVLAMSPFFSLIWCIPAPIEPLMPTFLPGSLEMIRVQFAPYILNNL